VRGKEESDYFPTRKIIDRLVSAEKKKTKKEKKKKKNKEKKKKKNGPGGIMPSRDKTLLKEGTQRMKRARRELAGAKKTPVRRF